MEVSVATMTLEFAKKHTKHKKNTLKTSCVPQVKVADCENKKTLGIEKYKEKLIDEALFEKDLKWMGSDDKKNTANKV